MEEEQRTPNFIDRAVSMQAHREAYIALIDAALASLGHGHGHANKREFAARLGITPQYLGNLLNAQSDTFSFSRTPGPALAHRLVQAVPLEKELRYRLLEHLQYVWYWEHGKGFASTVEGMGRGAPSLQGPGDPPGGKLLYRHTVEDLLSDLGQAQATATHTPDPAVARRYYRAIRAAGLLMLKRIDATMYPIQYAQVCLFLHDTLCVLNRADDGAYYARVAR